MQAISMKITRNIGILLCIKNCVTNNTLTLSYNSLILSNIQYGIFIGSSTFDSYMNPTIIMKKKVLRIRTSLHVLAKTMDKNCALY